MSRSSALLQFLKGAVLSATLAAAAPALAQTPKANGETVRFQTQNGPSNMFAIVAHAKGFCDKYNFKCEPVLINSGSVGQQSLLGGAIEVSYGTTEYLLAAKEAGADLVITGAGARAAAFVVAVQSGLDLPNAGKPYPENIVDLKGKIIGVPARGTPTELMMTMVLRDAGLTEQDVTYIAVGSPADSYLALTVGKQVDAVFHYQPLNQFCQSRGGCDVMADFAKGEAPELINKAGATSLVSFMRRDFPDANPKLMEAYYAAMNDASEWINDPANFDELVEIYTPIIAFGDDAAGQELRRNWLKEYVGTVLENEYKVSVDGVKGIIEFASAAGLITKPVEPSEIIWSGTPTK